MTTNPSPAGTVANSDTNQQRGGGPWSDMVNLCYIGAIPRASYLEWRQDPSKSLSPIKPATRQNLEDMDTTTKQRHDIGYINANLTSWNDRVHGQNLIPTFETVRAAAATTVAEEVEYDRDGLVWRSDYHIRIQRMADGTMVRKLVIHLPNDGYFYVSEQLLPVLVSGRRNDRHLNTCPEGWAYLDAVVWPKLAPFENWARRWFGFIECQTLRRQILYNDLNNRMDICLKCPSTNVVVEFSFEPGYPMPEVPESFWF